MGLVVEDEVRERVLTRLKELGYQHVTLDLAPFRSGSLNIDFVKAREGSR
jgi:PP-loop superfamily ATP-utilizing enzyme